MKNINKQENYLTIIWIIVSKNDFNDEIMSNSPCIKFDASVGKKKKNCRNLKTE